MQGKTLIKACYNRSEESMRMESHGDRALLRLYQKVATPNETFDDPEESLYSSFDDAEGAAGQTDKTEEPSIEGGAVKKPSDAEAKTNEKQEETCPVCLEAFTMKVKLKCKHELCEMCLERSVQRLGAMCPFCSLFGLVEGDQPEGTMTWFTTSLSLPGFEPYGRIEITYNIPSGTQTAKHPSPGQQYEGITRKAYLPDNRKGNKVLLLLKRAFDKKLIFTFATCQTTGAKNVIVWNGIHHKTSTDGGPQNFGYPDPNYLSRVKDELKAKGIN